MPEKVNQQELEASVAGETGTEDEIAEGDREPTTAGRNAVATAEAGDVATLRQEKESLQDRLLRTAAEFDNFRKRIERERRDWSEFATSEVLSDLLPILDNFERALQSPVPPEADAFRKGIELIHKQMLELLRKRGVKPIDALGSDFDPRVHQAVIQEASDTHREGEVMEELQRGYMLGERLLRPAMVKVAKGS